MKEWDPGNWNGNIWAVPDEVGDIELLNFDASSLPMEATALSPSEEVNCALPEEPVVASPEVVALQDIVGSLQEPPSATCLCFSTYM